MRDQWLVGRHSHDDLCGASLQLNHLPRIVILSSLYIVGKTNHMLRFMCLCGSRASEWIFFGDENITKTYPFSHRN
jgi:hypothetical protein